MRSIVCRHGVAILVLVALLPSLAFGQGSRAGVVTTLEGNVTVTSLSAPQPRPLKFRDDVFVNDRVVTGDRSIARMLLGGKAVVTVRERSALTITEVPGKSTIALDNGKIAVAVAREKMKPGEEIEVRTPNAIAGVRGTVFVAEVTRATAALDNAQGGFTSSFYGFTGTVVVRFGNQVITLLPGTYATGTGAGTPFSDVMSSAIRAAALSGLQAKLKSGGGATQQLANEHAYGTTVATFGDGTAAVGGEGPSTPPGQNVTAPLLPGGVSTIPIRQDVPPLKAVSSAFLIFGDRSLERGRLGNVLGADFPNRVVVDVATLPSDISAFGTIWHVGAFEPLSTSEQTRLGSFVARGGGLHLTGERPCCETLNESITTFLRSVIVNGSGIVAGGQGDVSGPFTFNRGAAGGIAANLSEWTPIAPGALSGVSGANVLATGAGGVPVGGVWDRADVQGDGRVTLLMDVNWLETAGAPDIIRAINGFIDGPPNTLMLNGPLFRSVGDQLGEAGEALIDVAGYTIIGAGDAPLVSFNGSAATLPGSLLRLTDSGVTTAGSFLRAEGGGAIVQTGSEPLVWMSGGYLHVGVGGSQGNLVEVLGRPGITAVDADSGLVVGADRPLQPGPGATVLRADNGAIVSARGSAYLVDTALLAATAPLLELLRGSALTTGGDAVSLVRQAKVDLPGDAVAMMSLRSSALTVANGHLVNVQGGSRLNVGGSLLSVADGSSIRLLNGALLNVGGGSVVTIGGSLVSFTGSGNTLSVTNSFVPTALIGGIPVYGPSSSFSISGTPLAGLGTAGTITINGVPLTPSTPLSSLKGSLITVQGPGSVKIGP